MKTIVVPTDFSANAEHALLFAKEFAMKEKARLIIIHIYFISYPAAEASVQLINEIKAEAKAEAEVKLQGLVKKLHIAGTIPVELVALEGGIVDSIIDFSRIQKSCLIIMGTQGVNSVGDRLFGSTTVRIIEQASCPVLAIPEHATFDSIKNISFTTNYDKKDIFNLQNLVGFASYFGARINVLHITDPEQSADNNKILRQQFEGRFNKRAPDSHLSFEVISGNDFNETIQNYIKEKSVDMLVLSTHHHNFFEKLAGKSVTRKLASHINIPIMVYHNSDKE